jgi:tRNA-Thr(GGU) m(6)t(6)A37 methyltransferase TsaA
MDDFLIKRIAVVKSGFKTKFGLPRQSGLVENLKAQIIFEKDYSNPEFFKGLEEYSHIWIIWGFSESKRDKISPTVRPPRLGGNKRMGVFATRSPFRPNPLALSCVKLESVNFKDGIAILNISGCDMMDDTPVYDIKPYLPYCDLVSNASGGFTEKIEKDKLKVNFEKDFDDVLSDDEKSVIIKILEEDPRPAYQDDEERIYGFCYKNFEIKFKVSGDCLRVEDIIKN